MDVYKRLISERDFEYKKFQSKLVPNISPDTMIGVRTPQMRLIAKEIMKEGHAKDFLSLLPHKYYEENMIHFFLISMIKDFDECVEELEKFLPFIDCWPVCDQSSPRVFKKNHERLLPLIKKWISSGHVYTSRFGMRMLMNEFLDADFKSEYLELVASKMPPSNQESDYYLKMMAAWFFATALAKQYDAALPFIVQKKLEPWTHNKAIQKALESFRVPQPHKEFLSKLKI